VNQRRGLELLSRLFESQELRRQLAQLIIDRRQQLLASGRITPFDRGQDAGNFAHAPRRGPPGLQPETTFPNDDHSTDKKQLCPTKKVVGAVRFSRQRPTIQGRKYFFVV
jgi:hypothetical protein